MNKPQVPQLISRVPSLAEVECARNDWSFEEVFRYQFFISRSEHPKPCDAWVEDSLAGWQVQHCPKLPSCRLISQQGDQIGLILGIAISPEGHCLQGDTVYPDAPDQIVEWIEQLSGRFVLLSVANGQESLYLDPAGNLATVYDAERQIIASSVHLIVTETLKPHSGLESDLVLNKSQRYLFGETSDHRIIRARPNHFLRLSDFTEVRHWPRPETLFAELDRNRDHCIAEISARLSQNIDALTAQFTCGLPVTAGMDSRIILACAKPFLDRIRSFYCYRLNESTKIDAEAAVRLAEQLAVPMLVISRRSPTFKRALPAGFSKQEHDKMLLRTGRCFAVRSDWAPYVGVTPELDVVLRGTGLEMTRANKWSEENSAMPCDPVNGLRTLAGLRPGKQRTKAAQDRYEHLLECYRSWAGSLPDAAQERLYDLAHIELMLPHGPVLEYSAYAAHFVVNPFNDRRLYQLTAAIAPRARMQRRIVRKIILRNARYLLNIPFHREWPR